MKEIKKNQILIGSLFNEPMRVEIVEQIGPPRWVVGLVGVSTEKYRKVTLDQEQLNQLVIQENLYTYTGDGQLLRLGLQAYSLGIAYEFDPYFALSVSKVDPLPHQLEAVYDYLLKLARVRFLLADDAGAGKTIMAGLLLKELKLRGLAESILIVCPANLTFQWQRELNEKFDEKFLILKGGDIREQYGINQWMEHPQVITSLDLAKRSEILPGLRQRHWDLVIVDEAHRMSWTPPSKKTARYALGELLRESSDHMLLLTATPHKGDPENFSLFLQLLDQDAYADVKSIRQAIERKYAPFYLRRTKEAMVYFPQKQTDGTWVAKKIFTKRITHSVNFLIDGTEFELYREVSRFVKQQSAKADAQGDDPRARAVGFLMALYQRRLASSTYSLRHSLENRARRLEEGLKKAREIARLAPPDLPSPEELEEMEDGERERLEEILEAITLTENPELVQEEIEILKVLASKATLVEEQGAEAKLSRLKTLLQEEGFFANPDQRLLIFTEFKDTLDYLVGRFQSWGFRVGCIHGSMKIGSRNEPNTRLYTEQQFKDGAIQILVATEAAGEGINLQCCNILFNYDIPWNPNRLEQRMGRIHRYLQTKDCLIFNFVAENTIEGKVLQKLLEKLQGIRDALDDDSVFNVVGEILPPAHIERVLREYYAGKLGDVDLEDRLLRNVEEDRFRNICQNALEGLASKRLNLEMLIERKARAQERRVVPETIARFILEASTYVPFKLKPVASKMHTFDPAGPTPLVLHSYENEHNWKLPQLANKYQRLSTDRDTAEKNNFEWVTPGHPLFEAVRRHCVVKAQEPFSKGTCFYSLECEQPIRVDFYRARVVDGLNQVAHERLFAVQIQDGKEPVLKEPTILGNLICAHQSGSIPQVISTVDISAWLYDNSLKAFLEEVKSERIAEIDRIASHIELSLTELIAKEDALIGRFSDEAAHGQEGAAGLLRQAEDRHGALLARREKRRRELKQQQSLSLQSVELLTSVVILPHPDINRPEVRRLKPDGETEAIAMKVAIENEEKYGRSVVDVHERCLGYDLTSLDTITGELRLIEVKGIGASDGIIVLTPNEHRVAEDRRDCYWLYVVTNCNTDKPNLSMVKDPATYPWQPVRQIQHFTLNASQLGSR